MSTWLMVLAQGAGFRKPTRRLRRARDVRLRNSRTVLRRQGGRGRRLNSYRASCTQREGEAAFGVGLAVSLRREPSADPTPAGSAVRCHGQRDGNRGGLTPLLTVRGRLTPTPNPRVGNSPLTPFPSAARQTAMQPPQQRHRAAVRILRGGAHG